jgi:LAS superfamily LD-carboxypeptidase LdcB
MKLKLFPFLVLIMNLLFAQNKINFSQDLLMGKEDSKLFNKSIGLLSEAATAFEKMKIAAQKAGFKIEIVSAYRSFNRQKDIWNRKYIANEIKGFSPDENIKKIIEYSTLPGTSRHHWGTDIDIIDGSLPRQGDVLVTEKFHGDGPYAALRIWMEENAAQFGFLRPYSMDFERKGFSYEPWHYSYAPLAIPMLVAYLKMDLNLLLVPENLRGREYITPLFIKKYIDENILGISSNLKLYN